MRAHGCVVRAEAEHLEGLVVGQSVTATGIYQAKTVPDVVESHVQKRREHGGLLLGG